MNSDKEKLTTKFTNITGDLFMDYASIMVHFGITDPIVSAEPFGSGHINDTIHVVTAGSGKEHSYVLQRLNTNVFPDPDILMNNAVQVTQYLAKIVEEKGGDVSRETVHFYPADNGKYYYTDENGKVWRLEDLISHTHSFDLCTSAEMFEQTGVAFGSFLSDLSSFPADRLGEVIKNFHNTRVRFETFTKEVKADKAGRLDSCRKEVEFALARKELAEVLVKELEEEKIPLRVTHNDTKINNILMDETTNQPVCIIDLDTIMPGAAAYDFGDSIRFGASNAEEDERDLSKVFMRMDLFEAFTRGYMRAVGKKLSLAEARSLAEGSIVITFETGIRFLGDYLNGDVYFKVARPQHNLDRARTQLKLVEDMEGKLPQMLEIVEKYWQQAQQQ